MDLTKLAKVEHGQRADGSPASDGAPPLSVERRSGERRGSSSGRHKQSTMGMVSVGMAVVSIVLAIIGVPAKQAAGYGTALILVVLMCTIAALCVVGISTALMGIVSKRRSPTMSLIGLVLNPLVAMAFAIFLWWPTSATLLAAAENGNAEGVEQALAMGVDVNAPAIIRDREQKQFVGSPLIGAAMNGQLATVTTLMSRGANVDASDSLKRTALFHAAKQGYGDVATMLLRQGADPNLSPDSKGPLYFAVEAGNGPLAELMLERGAQADAKADPPLLVAASIGHTKIAELLIDKGASFNAVDAQGNTALHIAAENGHQYIVKLLLRKQADVTIRNQFGETALERAIAGQYKAIIDDLVNVNSPIDIFAAIGLGDLDKVQKELESNPKLISAIRRGYTPLHLAAKVGRIEMVSYLLENGADPNAKTDDAGAVTPMYLATRGGQVEVAKALIANGVDVNQVVTVNGTIAPPLYFAVIEGFDAMVSVLLEAGADVNVRCQAPPEAGSTIPVVGSPLIFAAIHGRHSVAKLLLEAQANPEFRARPDGPTPLYEAVKRADLEMVTLLVHYKADVNAQVNGSSMLSVIEDAQRGHQKAESLDRIYSLLRDAGALDR